VAEPLSMISFATRSAMLEGIAKPTPMLPASPPEPPAVAMATLMPMSLPSESTSAPPELPGLMAASVWMTAILIDSPPDCCCCPWPKSKKKGPPWPLSPWSPLPPPSPLSGPGAAEEAISMERFSALTMPVVTLLESPSGAPTATV
jgi:hypothetical protein